MYLKGTINRSVKTNNGYDVFVMTDSGEFKVSEEELTIEVKGQDQVFGYVKDGIYIIKFVLNYDNVQGIGESSIEFRDMNLSEKLEFTGRDKDEPTYEALFKTLTLSVPEFKKIGRSIGINMLAWAFDIDFVCVECYDTLTFRHYAEPQNKESILQKGLLKSREYIPDLGVGVYCIKPDDITASENLYNYFSDSGTADKLIVVEGTYTGKYIYCVYSSDLGHEHYIVIPEDIPTANIEIIDEDIVDNLF